MDLDEVFAVVNKEDKDEGLRVTYYRESSLRLVETTRIPPPANNEEGLVLEGWFVEER